MIRVDPNARMQVADYLRDIVSGMRRKVLPDDAEFINGMLKRSDKFSEKFELKFDGSSIVFIDENGSFLHDIEMGSLRCYPIPSIVEDLKQFIF